MEHHNNYETFKRLFEKYGNKNHNVKNGSYAIYEVGINTYDACFLIDAGYGDSFQDPSLIFEVDDLKKEVQVIEYYNDFANAGIRIERNEETEKELDEYLYLFLERFETAVQEED
jgi:hypothetical protein